MSASIAVLSFYMRGCFRAYRCIPAYLNVTRLSFTVVSAILQPQCLYFSVKSRLKLGGDHEKNSFSYHTRTQSLTKKSRY